MPTEIITMPGELAYTLTELRKQHNLTQSDLADRLGVTQPTYAQWENERRKPSTTTVERICEVFDCAARVQPNGIWFFEIGQHDWTDFDVPDDVGAEHMHPEESGVEWEDDKG